MATFGYIAQAGRRAGLVLCLGCLWGRLASAQSGLPGRSAEVSGVVVDSVSQAGLRNVSVVLREAGQAQPVAATVSGDKGGFVLPDVPAGRRYELSLTHLGYRPRLVRLPLLAPPGRQLGQLVLAAVPTPLREVQVVAARPLIEQEVDKLTYHVADDPESGSLSTLDLLRKVPRLTVDADDNLRLNGQSSYQILINGNPSALFAQDPSEVLRSLPASTIQRIEVLTMPAARYDGAGGGVLNIVTRQKSLGGYSGSLKSSASSPAGASLGAYTTWQAGRSSASAVLNQSTQTSPSSHRRTWRQDFGQRNQFEQTGEGHGRTRAGFGSAELSWQPGARTRLGLSGNLSRSRGRSDNTQQATQRNAALQPTQVYRNVAASDYRSRAYDLRLDVEQSFRRPAQLLTVAYQRTRSTDANATRLALLPVLNYKPQASTTGNDESTQQHTLQADYVQPLGKAVLECGLKTDERRSRSAYYYAAQHPETGALQVVPGTSDVLQHRQRIYAAYASLGLTTKNWGLRTGARLEHTTTAGSFQYAGRMVPRRYANVLPSVRLTRRLSSSSNLALLYGLRLERPGVQVLNPYVDRTDPRNISFGNPLLRPATSHALQLTVGTFRNRSSLNADLSYQFTNSAIQAFTTLGPDSVARTTYGNLGRRRLYGCALSLNTTWHQRISLHLNAAAQHTQLLSGLASGPRRAGYSYNAAGSASYRLGRNWRTSGTVSYNSPDIQLQGRGAGYVWHTLAASKEFGKRKKAQAALTVASPLQRLRRSATETRTPAFYQQQESYAVARRVALSWSYRFSKVQGAAGEVR